MKIVSLIVENFRAIDRVELTDLQDMVVIAGPNGCGKSCEFAGTFGCAVGSSVADGAVAGVEWLAVGPGRD